MSPPFILCLDFDGVICHSAVECFVSSWIAYFDLIQHQTPVAVPLYVKEAFLSFRPFIRSGEDYVLIQELIDREKKVGSQKDFDSCIMEAGPEKMNHYKKIFYIAREGLIKKSREFWLSLNTIYSHMLEPLRRHASDTRVFIVSTKRSDFILELLKADGIHVTPNRVYYAGSKSKIALVREILSGMGSTRAIFVDDQIDHLRGDHMEDTEDILSCLAAWGYVKEEWLRESKGVKILSVDGMLKIFNDL